MFFLAGCDRAEPESQEFTVIATEVATSSVPTMDQIAPYDEALTTSEYQVRERLDGPESAPEPGDKLRVAHWAIVDGKGQPPPASEDQVRKMDLVPLLSIPGLDQVYRRDDLPFDPGKQLYLDLSQSLALPEEPALVRYDYDGPVSRRMQNYWMTRHQLRLAVIGNSHAGVGVNPRRFFQPENESIPVALSLCVPGSGLPLQKRMVTEYLLELPRIEWIVWGVSPRIFNRNHAIDRRDEIFQSSPGYAFDRENHPRLWPVNQDSPTVEAKAIREAIGGIDIWGWSAAEKREYPVPLTVEDEEKILSHCKEARFHWNEEAWTAFAETVQVISGRGIRLLLFTPPCHPLVRKGETSDFDGTGHQDYRRIVTRLQDLAETHPGVLFLDIHQGGNHSFTHEDFSNPDHLHTKGAEKLTRQLAEAVASVP